MSRSTFDLRELFGAALQVMAAHRQEINTLDGYNGNHGDNMVHNVRLIAESLQADSARAPAEALKAASQRLRSHGHGGASQYYAQGLSQAAGHLQGHLTLDADDVMALAQSILGTIPCQGDEQQPQVGGSVLEQFLRSSSTRSPVQPVQAGTQGNRPGLGDMLSVWLPASLAFLQAQQAGADVASAGRQALASVLLGGHVDPLQAGNPRAAAAGLIAQSILQVLTSRRQYDADEYIRLV